MGRTRLGRERLDLKIVERVGEVLRVAAATVVLPRYAPRQPCETEMKAGSEPVTVADREAEAMIGRALQSLLPQSRVVGEEACAADSSLLEAIGEGTVWIVDPIDGTANFAAGRPPFAMMV